MNKYTFFILIIFVFISLITSSFSVAKMDENIIHPNTYVASPNLHTIWQFTPSNSIGNINYTAAGNIFENGKMGFISWYKTNSNSYVISGISSNGIVMWNISVINYINFTIYGPVLNYSQTILVQSGAIIGPGISTFALYNAYNGNLIWMNNITLSDNQKIFPFYTGIYTNNGNATLLFLSYNKTSDISPNILIFENTLLLLNANNGSINHVVSYTTYGIKNVLIGNQNVYIIPSFEGLSSGGFMYYQLLPVLSNNSIVIYNYIVLYNLEGILLFNITAPTSNFTTISIITSTSVGNYFGGNNYYIAITFLNVFINNTNIKSEYGSIAILNVNGAIKYSIELPINNYPVSVQSITPNIFRLEYRLSPSTPIGNLIDYTGTGNPDLLLENVILPSGEAYLSVLNVLNNKFQWNSSLQFYPSDEIVEPLPYSFDGLPIPEILLISSSGNITALYGSNGTIMWKIVQQGDLIGTPYNSLAEFYPQLMNLTKSTLTSFITLTYFYNSSGYGNTILHINVYSSDTGNVIYIKNISLPSPPQHASLFPIGECYNTSTMDVGLVLSSKNTTGWNYYFYGISGNNGSFIFNGSESFPSNNNYINFQSGYVFGLFYQDLNNGQVSNDGRIDDVFFSIGSSIIAYNVNNYVEKSSKNSFSVILSSNVINGYAPLNVSFTVNVSGNMGPYKYVWIIGNLSIGNLSLLTNVSYLNYSFTQPGKYYVFVNVTDRIGNSIKSNTLYINVESKSSSKVIYYNITGYVTNTNNLPIEGVFIITSDGNKTITNQNGMFYVYLPNGTWQITAYLNGYYNTTVNITVNGRDITIYPPLILKHLPTSQKNGNVSTSSQNMNIGLIALIVILVVSLLAGIIMLFRGFKIH